MLGYWQDHRGRDFWPRLKKLPSLEFVMHDIPTHPDVLQEDVETYHYLHKAHSIYSDFANLLEMGINPLKYHCDRSMRKVRSLLIRVKSKGAIEQIMWELRQGRDVWHKAVIVTTSWYFSRWLMYRMKDDGFDSTIIHPKQEREKPIRAAARYRRFYNKGACRVMFYNPNCPIERTLHVANEVIFINGHLDPALNAHAIRSVWNHYNPAKKVRVRFIVNPDFPTDVSWMNYVAKSTLDYMKNNPE